MAYIKVILAGLIYFYIINYTPACAGPPAGLLQGRTVCEIRFVSLCDEITGLCYTYPVFSILSPDTQGIPEWIFIMMDKQVEETLKEGPNVIERLADLVHEIEVLEKELYSFFERVEFVSNPEEENAITVDKYNAVQLVGSPLSIKIQDISDLIKGLTHKTQNKRRLLDI